jgi:hypothetical protein
VLAAVAELASREFLALRNAALAMPLKPEQAVLLVRVARFIDHPELSSLLLPLSRSSSSEVREAVAALGSQRKDAMEPGMLESLIADPIVAVRHAAAGAAATAERYDLLEKMTEDPDIGVRRQIGIALGRSASVGPSGLLLLERLGVDPEMPVRAAAFVARLLQGTPVPLPPGIDPRVAAHAVEEASELANLREMARGTAREERRLAAALALALLQDDVAREVARTDPIPAIRHRVSGALELAVLGTPVSPQ